MKAFHAKDVANYLKTQHTEFVLKEKDALNELENIINHFDEPIADSSILPTALVSKMAKNHVTVCLSGDGEMNFSWDMEPINGLKDCQIH